MIKWHKTGIACHATMQRRKLKLTATIESSASHFSIKR
jgi:hypothetical protein